MNVSDHSENYELGKMPRPSPLPLSVCPGSERGPGRALSEAMLCVWLSAAPALTIPRGLGAAAALAPGLGAAGVFFMKRRRATNERLAAELREHLLSLTPVSSDTVSVEDTGTIKGRGLYARAALEPNTSLFDCTGELLPEDAAQRCDGRVELLVTALNPGRPAPSLGAPWPSPSP